MEAHDSADVMPLGHVLTVLDPTTAMLPNLHAPLVTVSLEQQSFHAAGPLARVPHWEFLLQLVRDGHISSELAGATGPAVADAHADLATFLAHLVIQLFDPALLQALPDTLACYRKLSDLTQVTRALLAQLRYVADVATSMPAGTLTTSGGVFRLCWRANQSSSGLAVRLRTVFLYLPQPVAACLAVPAGSTGLPDVLRAVLAPADCPQPDFLHARWRLDYTLQPSEDLLEWYLSRLEFGPLLMAACKGCRVSEHVFVHSQIPAIRMLVHIRLPLAGAPQGTTAAALHEAGWRPDLLYQMPRERHQPMLRELPLSLHHPRPVVPPDSFPVISDEYPAKVLDYYFLTGRTQAGLAIMHYLQSPARLAFGSAPPPPNGPAPRMRPPSTSFPELRDCLQATPL